MIVVATILSHMLCIMQVPKVHREFSMGVASMADSAGVMVAVFLSQGVHSFICSHYIGYYVWAAASYVYTSTVHV